MIFLSLTSKRFRRAEFTANTSTTELPCLSPQSLLHSDHLLEQGATQTPALDQFLSFANLMPQHEAAFPVHHHLNHLAFGLVVSVVVSAVVLDLVSTPDAHVLVPALAHLASPVVLVLDETAVVLDPFLIAVFAIATRTVVAHVVFAAETL